MTGQVERRLAAILSADVVGYTRLMHSNEEGTLARLHTYRNELIDPKIAEYGGRIVKVMGDGWLVEFTSVVDAVRCAADIQRAIAAYNAGKTEDDVLVLRIGINLGDVIVEDDDIYGDGVNVATRMQEIAPPGGVSVSGVVHDSVRDKLAPAFEDLGPQHVKNISEPVRAYRIVLDPEATGRKREVKRMPTPSGSAAATEQQKGRVFAILSSSQRGGTWNVPTELRVVAFMGSIDLDMREAVFGPGVTEVRTTNIMGSIGILVPPNVSVKCEGIGILGQFDEIVATGEQEKRPPFILRITGVAFMGHTAVR